MGLQKPRAAHPEHLGQNLLFQKARVFVCGKHPGAPGRWAGCAWQPRVTSQLGLSSGELQPGMRKIPLTWGASTNTSP